MHRPITLAVASALLFASFASNAQDGDAIEFRWGGFFDNDRDSIVIYEGQSIQTFTVCLEIIAGVNGAVIFSSNVDDVSLTQGSCTAVESSRIRVRTENGGGFMSGTFMRLD